jgi:hypothetical protein
MLESSCLPSLNEPPLELGHLLLEVPDLKLGFRRGWVGLSARVRDVSEPRGHQPRWGGRLRFCVLCAALHVLKALRQCPAKLRQLLFLLNGSNTGALKQWLQVARRERKGGKKNAQKKKTP